MLFGWKNASGLRRFRTAYLEIPRKNGKALALDTLLPTLWGWKTIEEIKIDDTLFDEEGNQCKVTYVSDIMYNHKCYELIFSDGTKAIADREHLWWTKPRSRTGGVRGKKNSSKRIFTTEQILETLSSGDRKKGKYSFREHNHSIPVAKPLNLPKQPFILDPYLLGVWLGDGHTSSNQITTTDQEILDSFLIQGFEVKEIGKTKITFGIKGLSYFLYELGILNNKHIPTGYLRGSYEQRLSLLQGLMDTDGCCSKRGESEFTTVNKALAEGVYELIGTLGIKTRIREEIATIYDRKCGLKYRIQFHADNNIPIFRLPKKYIRQRPQSSRLSRSQTRQICEVKEIESVPVRCIQVDSPSKLFLITKSFIPTHNTTFVSALGLYLFCADEEPGAEIYSAGVKRDQAIISHSEASRMVQQSPFLKKRIGTFKNNLHIMKTASKFEPLGRDSDSCDGLNVHGAIIDELHAHKTRDMWDVMETATGARRQPLQIAITTAGYNRDSICWEQHTYTEKILNKTIQDDNYFGMIYTIDKNDKWNDETSWIKANPNLGVSVKLDDLQRKCRKATELPSAQNTFLRKHLNVWVQQSDRWIDLALWDRNYLRPIQEDKLRGRLCFGGLDLSSVTDLTAWVLVFPDEEDPEFIDVLCRFWCPEKRLYDRQNKYRDQYQVWKKQGYLETTPGDAIDYQFIKSQILKDAEVFQIESANVDRLFQGYQMMMELEEEGLNVTPIGMGFLSMAIPMRELNSSLLKGKINHGNNPVLKWMADNMAVRTDPAGNLKPDKAESQGKIDGIVAMVIALDRVMRYRHKDPDYLPMKFI